MDTCGYCTGMKTLTTYLNSLPRPDQEDFARRVRTSVGYLRNAVSSGKKLGADICMAIERESGRVVRCEDLRPDLIQEFSFLRSTGPVNDKMVRAA